jgi:hypothetical protein
MVMDSVMRRAHHGAMLLCYDFPALSSKDHDYISFWSRWLFGPERVFLFRTSSEPRASSVPKPFDLAVQGVFWLSTLFHR